MLCGFLLRTFSQIFSLLLASLPLIFRFCTVTRVARDDVRMLDDVEAAISLTVYRRDVFQIGQQSEQAFSLCSSCSIDKFTYANVI